MQGGRGIRLRESCGGCEGARLTARQNAAVSHLPETARYAEPGPAQPADRFADRLVEVMAVGVKQSQLQPRPGRRTDPFLLIPAGQRVDPLQGLCEPGGPTYSGFEIPGDNGSFTLNSVGSFKMQGWGVRGSFVPVFRHAPGLGRYPVVAEKGMRTITLDVSLYLENTSDVSALRHLAYTKAVLDGALVIGETAGSILTLNCKNMQIPEEQVADAEAEQILTLSGLRMNATSFSAMDEFSAVWT